jgi:hypothetical protein
MIDFLTNENYILVLAKRYDNPQVHSTEEFYEDLKRIKYIKKLITRYIETSELKERLILNHLIVLNNLFGSELLCKIIFLKMENHIFYIKPFLVLLNILPEKIVGVGKKETIDTNLIGMDENIVKILRNI